MHWGQFAEAWPRPMPVSSRYSRVCIIQYEEDQQVRSVVLTGNEKAFVAGADIGHIAKASIGDAYHLTDLTMRVQERLADLPNRLLRQFQGTPWVLVAKSPCAVTSELQPAMPFWDCPKLRWASFPAAVGPSV
jgi:hypothetical protein